MGCGKGGPGRIPASLFCLSGSPSSESQLWVGLLSPSLFPGLFLTCKSFLSHSSSIEQLAQQGMPVACPINTPSSNGFTIELAI